MGLRCDIDVEDMGFPMETPVLAIPIDYSEGLDTFCSVFIDASTSMCPVDTGYLQSTLDADNDGFSAAEAWTDCEYAQYQEYGTWCMGAQPYFEPAIAEALGEAMPLWQEAYQEALQEEQDILAEMEREVEASMGMGFGAMLVMAIIIGIVRGIIEGFKEALSTDENHRGGGSIGFSVEIT